MKDKIIELIGAYLPDEQKADTEAKIGGLVDEFQKEQIIQTKKELSKNIRLIYLRTILTKPLLIAVIFLKQN